MQFTRACNWAAWGVLGCLIVEEDMIQGMEDWTVQLSAVIYRWAGYVSLNLLDDPALQALAFC